MDNAPGGPTATRRPYRLLRTVGLVSSVVGVLAVLAVLSAVVAIFAGWNPSLNPFHEKTIDRTGASVLRSLSDLSEYHAATGHYETVVDLQKDANLLPDFVSGERVLYVGKGDVDAIVDFGELDSRRVAIAPDGKSVTVRLPAPLAAKPILDLEHSYVVEHDSGLINKFKGSQLEREAQLRAVQQMTAAANGEGMLLDRAKQNTTSMLRGLFGALGYTAVTVTFDEDSR